ncbi:hypothetical protein DRP53_02180 [candidate division WOR-3 bacterium]|uniref:Uncharacterized protein n=1 Tax=candidate division WOR-3 bacterium TaxID=2052148 RepID=A0A660SKJ3_UNCW3|nr:MAG: hypothetical protein DRP53_02180 [candidate division WOR-3 bacterium]
MRWLLLLLLLSCTPKLNPFEIFNLSQRYYDSLNSYQDRFSIKVTRIESGRTINYAIVGRTIFNRPNLRIIIESPAWMDSIEYPILLAPAQFLSRQTQFLSQDSSRYLGTKFHNGKLFYHLQTTGERGKIDWLVDCRSGRIARVIITSRDSVPGWYQIIEEYRCPDLD